MRKLAAGNWKMNGTQSDLAQITQIGAAFDAASVDILICPPAQLLIPAVTASPHVAIGAQDCHANASGAHTGDMSAPQIRDTGATYVIVGHSERRTDHGETDATVNAKAAAAVDAGLIAIICIGETLQDRDNGATLNVLAQQLTGSVPALATAQNTVIAYEPVWAIGTGLIPTLDQIAQAHAFIREHLTAQLGATAADMRLLYGGSVKGSNAADIFAVPHVDGALVGGASLTAQDFAPIITDLQNA